MASAVSPVPTVLVPAEERFIRRCIQHPGRELIQKPRSSAVWCSQGHIVQVFECYDRALARVYARVTVVSAAGCVVPGERCRRGHVIVFRARGSGCQVCHREAARASQRRLRLAAVCS